MSGHLDRAIQKLIKKLIKLSAMVESNLSLAIESMKNDDQENTEKLYFLDREVDVMEVDIEEECLKILALHQPVAVDLRYIIAALKINNDLERIGDLALDIAKHSKELKAEAAPEYFEFSDMYSKVEKMLNQSIDSLVNLDIDLAFNVLKSDDEVDRINRENIKKGLEEIKKNPVYTDSIIRYLQISRRLERVADLATNIAEDIIYLINGDIVRHGVKLDRFEK